MEIIYLMCAENKSLAWTVGDEQASPSLDLVTTNLASSVLSKGAEKPDAKGKKGKAGKDPNKPKRAPSTFFVFMGEFREEFKQKNPKNKSVAAERLPMCPRPTSSRASTTRPLLPTTRVR